MAKKLAVTDIPEWIRRKVETWPVIVRLKEKHSTVYYVANDWDELGRIALETMKLRYAEVLDQIVSSRPPILDAIDAAEGELAEAEKVTKITDEQITVLPADVQEVLKSRRDEAHRQIRLRTGQLATYKRLQGAMAANDKGACLEIALEFDKREYEGFMVITPCKIGG